MKISPDLAVSKKLAGSESGIRLCLSAGQAEKAEAL